ncbi:penicillin acylase family protein [uncultured Pseudoteredinibacter sp.]|uniref:penicillin acylase family protein n=1 Tax=uncultured Pseudoteredinibacter sp. TaxID=1641701 RepID=UPI00262FD7E3|nr:penicillin acylase family protein [uncultured Pseudoteredinibacter sp.]
MKSALSLALISMGLVSSCGSPELSSPQLAKEASQSAVEIIRDEYGTPHIYGEDNYGVYYGYGYAIAEDRLYQMEMLRRTVLGQVSEVLGDKYLSLDEHIRRSYNLADVQRQLAEVASEERSLLEAYAQGFNARVEEVLANKNELLPLEFKENDFLPKQWQAYDVAMIFAGAIAHRYSDFSSERDNLALWQSLRNQHGEEKAWDIFNASKWLLDHDSPTTVPRDGDVELQGNKLPKYLNKLAAVGKTSRVAVNQNGEFQGITNDPAIAESFETLIAKNGFTVSAEFSPASNFWSVSSAKTEGANGVLLNGPQFGWSLPSYVNGIGLHGGDFEVAGNTLLGLPALLFAHNNKIAWGSTAGLSDQVDEYILKLNPENPEQYWHKGEYKNFQSWEETIHVKGGANHKLKARKSAQGMVMIHLPEEGVAVSRARAWEGKELATLLSWIELSKKDSIHDAKKAVEGVATNINFYYMDIKGNIAYTHGGNYPQRVAGHDPRLPVPGDGSYDWLGMRPYSENPSVENPAQAYISNWNNRPSADWVVSDLWPLTWGRAHRVQHINQQLESQATFTPEEVWAINKKVSYRDSSLPYLLPYLQKALSKSKLNDIERAALKTLESWDQNWIADEQGNYPAAAAIAENFVSTLVKNAIHDDVGDDFFYLYSATGYPTVKLGPSMLVGSGTRALIKNLDALASNQEPIYDFFSGQSEQVLQRSFREAVKRLMQQQGLTVSAWKIPSPTMEWLGVNFRGVPQAAKRPVVEIPEYANRGSENNLFIARGDRFEAYDSIPPGQSGFVNTAGEEDPHYRDQLEMFSQFKYKKIPASKDEILQSKHKIKLLVVNK